MSSEVSFNGRSQCRKIIFKVDEIFEKCNHSFFTFNEWSLPRKSNKSKVVSAAPTAQNSPELKIHIRNVDQDTSVYYRLDGRKGSFF